jgi:predicted HAD superfamily Cof-like phosphohydrolase
MSRHLRLTLAEFHLAMGTPRFLDLNRHERMACAALRAELLAEEGRELRAADVAQRQQPSRQNHQHLAKELGDLLYVTAGTADIFRTPLIDPVETAQMPTFFAEGNVIQRTSTVIASLNLLVHQLDIGWTAYDVLLQVDEIGSELQDVVQALAEMAAAYGIPLLRVFDAVHVSNMSKIDPTTGAPALRADGKILKGPAYSDADLSFLTHNAA